MPDGTATTETTRHVNAGRGRASSVTAVPSSSGVDARVAALLHESRRSPPDDVVYRHRRRSGLDLPPTYRAMDAAIASRGHDEMFVTCVLGRLDLLDEGLTRVNVGHPLALLVRGGEVVGPLKCAPTLPAGFGGDLAEVAHDTLEPADRVFCITDGSVDFHRAGGEDFGQGHTETVDGLRGRGRE